MKYEKPALTFAEQANRLLSRGLVADHNELVNILKAVSYYRLSAYWHTFRIEGDPDDRLRPGTTLTMVWNRYVFDRQLRLLVMDAIERVEVVVPEQYMGDVIGDLNSKRGQIQEMFDRGQMKVVKAIVPLASMFGYVTSLRSMSQGRASSSMEFGHYADVPGNVAANIIAGKTK